MTSEFASETSRVEIINFLDGEIDDLLERRISKKLPKEQKATSKEPVVSSFDEPMELPITPVTTGKTRAVSSSVKGKQKIAEDKNLPMDFLNLVYHEEKSTPTYDFYSHKSPKFIVLSHIVTAYDGLGYKKKASGHTVMCYVAWNARSSTRYSENFVFDLQH